MQRRIFYLAFLVVFFNIFSLVGYAAEDQTSADESSKKPFYIEIKSKGTYFKRDKNFHLGNVGNWNLGVNGTMLYLHDFDMDRWGTGYEIVTGLNKEDLVRLEASFEQYFSSFKKVKQGIIGVGAGDLSVMPFIDSEFGAASKGFFITAAVPVGVNAPGDLTLKYNFDYRSWHLNVVNNFLNKDNFVLDLFGGPACSRFSQRYKVDTTGTNPWGGGGGGATLTNTSESLIDGLFGAQMGLKGEMRLSKKLSFGFREAVDLFYRRSEFEGIQNITNACNIDDFSLDNTLKISRRTTGFVPHLASNVNLAYHVSPNTLIKLSYQFDFWNNLARIENPTLTGDLVTTTGSAHIAKEDVSSHAVGASVVIKF